MFIVSGASEQDYRDSSAKSSKMLSFDPYAIFFRPLSRYCYASYDTLLQTPSLFYPHCDIADLVTVAPQMKAD